MRLEFDAPETKLDRIESVLSEDRSSNTSETPGYSSYPRRSDSCAGTAKGRPQIHLDTILMDLSKDLLAINKSVQIPSEKSISSVFVKDVSYSQSNSLNRLKTSQSFKRQDSFNNFKTLPKECGSVTDEDRQSTESVIEERTNTCYLTREMKPKDCSPRPSSKSCGEPLSDASSDIVLVNDDVDDDVNGISYISTNLPVSSSSTPTYQQHRQPRMRTQSAVSMSQDMPWKSNDLSLAPNDKTTIGDSHSKSSVTPECPRSTKTLTNCLSSDYSLLRYNQFINSSFTYGFGAGSTPALEHQYIPGMACNSHALFLPKRTSSGASNATTQCSNRKKSSPCRLELKAPISLSKWSTVDDTFRQSTMDDTFSQSSMDDTFRQKGYPLDQSFDRFRRLHRENAHHLAYRRALSEHLLPFAGLRDLHIVRHRSQDDGLMEESSTSEDGMMYFSGSHGQSDSGTVHNGNSSNNGETCGHDTVMPPSMIAAKSSPVLVGAAKRKSKPSMDVSMSAAAHNQQQHLQQQQQNLLMMAAQQGLSQQQIQHALQQQHGLPHSIQQMIQQQSLALQQVQHQKLHEQLLHSLNEQLQMNLMHQAQLLKDPSGKGNKSVGASINNQSLQALLMQHQQIMQQIQLVQRQFALASVLQPFGMHQGMMSPAELQQLWKEVSLQSGAEDNAMKVNGLPSTPVTSRSSNNFTSSNGLSSKMSSLTPYLNGEYEGFSMTGMKSEPTSAMQGSSSSSTSSSKDMVANGNNSVSSHPLYVNKCCKWPNCEAHLEEFPSFIKHLNTEHQLDDRSTAQSRVQMEVVSSLESQLAFQKKVLKAMTDHLHQQSVIPPTAPPISQPHSSSSTVAAQHSSSSSSMSSSSQLSPMTSHDLKHESLVPHLMPKTPTLLNPNMFPGFLPPVSMVPSPIMPMPPSHRPPQLVSTSGSHGSGSSSSLPPTPTRDVCSSGGISRGGSDGGGPVRRRVSDKCNLPISAEIHRNHEFYKNTDVRPPFTYASLIRQAIIESPHRQLTLNEIYQWFQNTFAYFRRNEATWKNAVRHNLSLHKCFMRVENVKGAVWTVDEIEFYKRRPQKLGTGPGSMKSPSLNDQACYNETLSASLRAALGEGMGMIGAGILHDQESAQDLSMKATGHDGFGSGQFDEAELMMRIKQEVQDVYPDLDFSNPQPLSYRCSPSSQQDEHDPKGIEVKGGQMVMMPDVMDHYDNKEVMDEEEEARKEEEIEERNTEMEKRIQRKNSAAEYDEESSREQEERQHFEDEEEDCNIDRSRNETEAERELRAVQEKLEREQAEDLRNEYSVLENGYRSKENGYRSKAERSYNRHHHYLSLPTRFSPLNAADKDDRHRHSSGDQSFLGRSFFHQSGEDRASSMHESPEALFFSSEKPISKSHQVVDDAKDAMSHNTDSSMTRPFVVQLPDSGPVFPTSHHQTVVSRAPSIDITVSGSS